MNAHNRLIRDVQAGEAATSQILKWCENWFAPHAEHAGGDVQDNLNKVLASIASELLRPPCSPKEFWQRAEQLARQILGMSQELFNEISDQNKASNTTGRPPAVHGLMKRIWRGWRARNELAKICREWIRPMAFTFFSTWKSPEDFIQAALVAIDKGLPTFTWKRAKSGFKGWAVKVARNAMLTELQIPPKIYREIRILLEAHEDLLGETGRKPTYEDLAERTGIPVQRVVQRFRRYALEFGRCLEGAVSSGALGAAAVYADPTTYLKRIELEAAVKRAMNTLPEKYQEVLKLVYFQDVAQSSASPGVETVASIVGISDSAARKRVERGRELLRTSLCWDGFHLSLMSTTAADGIPASGLCHLIIAKVLDGSAGIVHFRIFDREGIMVVDQAESGLQAKSKEIASLKVRLAKLWGKPAVANAKRISILEAVTSITGYCPTDDL